jgi:hypothetical protein
MKTKGEDNDTHNNAEDTLDGGSVTTRKFFMSPPKGMLDIVHHPAA